MLIALVALTACRRTETAEPVAATWLRTFEARISDQVAYEDCGSPSEPRGALQPTLCSPPTFEEVRTTTAADGPRTGSLAATVRRIDLSPTESTLRRALETLTLSQGAETAEQLIASGAIYHALAQETGDPSLLVEALERAEHAVELDPESSAARFNRALIEADLGLCRQARQHWAEYLAGEPEGAWADEVEARRAALPCGPSESTDQTPEVGIEAAAEDLLSRWAEAMFDDRDEARRILEEIARRGEVLARTAEDPWLRSLAGELRRSSDRRAAAVRAYAEGRARFEAEDYQGAEPYLRHARRLLDAESVLTPWCDLWLAGFQMNDGDLEAAERTLGGYRRDPEVQRSPLLAGRIDWTLGLAALRAVRLETALDLFASAAYRLDRGGYSSHRAWVGTLEAETLARLGFVGPSWVPRIDALRVLQRPGSLFAFHNGLIEGAKLAARTGSPRAAHAFLNEAFAFAREREDTRATTEVRLVKGDVALQEGKRDEAAGIYRQVVETARGFDEPAVRDRLLARARLGAWAARLDADVSESEVEEVIGHYVENGPGWLEIEALQVRARLADLRQGDRSPESLIYRVIRRIRSMQDEIGDEPMRFQHWEAIQSVFDEAIARALVSGRPILALALLEEARRPDEPLSEALPFETCRPGPLPDSPSRAAGGDGAVTLVYGVIREGLAWWLIDGNECRYGYSGRDPARRAVEELLDGAQHGGGASRLEDLYRDLLKEPLRGVAPGRPVVLVPDRYLLRVPFAALENPETGRHLVQERAVRFATRFLEPEGRARSAMPEDASSWRALVVGDPAFDRRTLPWLATLPNAAREGETIATLYGARARLLTGRDATAEQVRSELSGRHVLHLATHAIPGAEAKDVLVLAADPATGASGLVSSRDLLGHGTLSPSLVVLSGCSTLGSTPSRSGGLVGLAEPFLGNGSSAVVGTLWPMDDADLRRLMTHFHQGLLEGLPASEALRRAQLGALEAEPTVGGYGWAGIQLIGEITTRLPAAHGPGVP